jgi:hypothetical protein
MGVDEEECEDDIGTRSLTVGKRVLSAEFIILAFMTGGALLLRGGDRRPLV